MACFTGKVNVAAVSHVTGGARVDRQDAHPSPPTRKAASRALCSSLRAAPADVDSSIPNPGGLESCHDVSRQLHAVAHQLKHDDFQISRHVVIAMLIGDPRSTVTESWCLNPPLAIPPVVHLRREFEAVNRDSIHVGDVARPQSDETVTANVQQHVIEGQVGIDVPSAVPPHGIASGSQKVILIARLEGGNVFIVARDQIG